MGKFSVIEDRPTPKSVYNWRVWASAIIASFGSCMIGYDSAFIGTTLALPSFVDEFGFDNLGKDELALVSANIVSLYQAGAFFGALFAYPVVFYVGRKRSLLIFVPTFILGSGLMLGATGDRGLGLIYAGRVLAGLGVGGSSMAIPAYISEISPPAIRGRLVGIYEMGWQVGGLVGFWINYGINQHLPPNHAQWLIPFAVQLIPAGLLGIGCFWIRESPRWLYAKGRREEARKNLCWIRQLPPDDVYLLEELALMDAELEAQDSGLGISFWKPFRVLGASRKLQWRFFMGGLLFLFQNGSGINAVNYYSPTVFKSIGIQGTNATFFTTGLFGVVKTVFTLVWLLWLVDNVGRRNLLVYGSLGGSICMWIIGAYIWVADPSAKESLSDASMSPGGTAAIFFFYLWTVFYTPSWNGTPWIINSEIFDSTVRSLAQASASANNWFWNFIISRFTPQMFLAMGVSGAGVYFFFASMMLLSLVFVWFSVPETKGIPLEFMNRLFDARPTRKAHAIVLEEIRSEAEVLRLTATAGEKVLDGDDDTAHTEHGEINQSNAHTRV